MRGIPSLEEIDPIVGALTTLVSLLALLTLRARLSSQSLPPGPKRWPMVGSAFSVPKEREWLEYELWSRKFGAYAIAVPHCIRPDSLVIDSDVLYYESWGRPFVVISSLQAAIDLFEKKSSLYADRCVLTISRSFVRSICARLRPRMRMLTDLYVLLLPEAAIVFADAVVAADGAGTSRLCHTPNPGNLRVSSSPNISDRVHRFRTAKTRQDVARSSYEISFAIQRICFTIRDCAPSLFLRLLERTNKFVEHLGSS